MNLGMIVKALGKTLDWSLNFRITTESEALEAVKCNDQTQEIKL